jgi:hypothetical protein
MGMFGFSFRTAAVANFSICWWKTFTTHLCMSTWINMGTTLLQCNQAKNLRDWS